MSKKRNAAGGKPSALSLSEWSLRRKVALALAIPMVLAGVFGGLRVRSELVVSENYSASASQVTVLRPAVAYLAAAERAAVVARERTAADDPARDAAVMQVQQAGVDLERARDSAELTSTQLDQVDSVLDLSAQLRTEMGYVSIGQSVAQVRLLHRGVIKLIDTIVAEQIEPEPRLQILSQTLDGRVSLAMQQLAVAYGTGDLARPRQLAAEIGIESAAIERLGVALGATDPLVLSLRQQNALHLGTIRDNGTDLGDESAYVPYDQLSGELLTGIDRELSAAAAESRRLAIINTAVTLGTLLAAIILALLISRLLLNPMRRVREGALEVAREQLPQAVARIRAGGDPGEIVPIDVTTHEEMGQLARAVDDLHRQAVHLASGEARVRAQVGDMLVTLSRRNTSLINQQLGLIERLEKDEEDPQRLESLFRLDHLASRMRRTAESLMILADAPTTTGDLDGLSVADSLHAATAGVQDYQRVQLLSSPTEQIHGSAAADVVHLVTELVDNALSYSPPTAPVLVVTTSSPGGMIISISDAGLGIPEDALAGMNADLHGGGEVTPDTARRMGLLVVSRLASRHGILVTLDHNERGGTTATVILPTVILTAVDRTETPFERPAALAAVPEPVAEAPAAVSVPADEKPAVPAEDRIDAAINAAMGGLPQRRPGTSASPAALTPLGGGSLLERLNARDDLASAELEQRRPVAVAPVPKPEVVAEAEAEAELDLAPEPTASAPLVEPVPHPVLAPVASGSVVPIGTSVTSAAEAAPVAMPATASSYGVLDRETPAPDSPQDESPIFRTLHSNWLGSGDSAAPWASSEVEAGWEAAGRVATTPPTQLSEGGLPMRRPGNRLVPGGVAPASTEIARDPEAIRARLAAHAAGVSRGRSAAVETVPADRSQKEAGLS